MRLRYSLALIILVVNGCVDNTPPGMHWVCEEEHHWYQYVEIGDQETLIPMEECDRGHYEHNTD